MKSDYAMKAAEEATQLLLIGPSVDPAWPAGSAGVAARVAEGIRPFFDACRAVERERCANVATSHARALGNRDGHDIAATIRILDNTGA